jgi:hypothetical protein
MGTGIQLGGFVKRWIIFFAKNVDALVPLLLGIAVSVLGLLDIVTQHIVDNSILLALAVLSFALLRDRWIKDSADEALQLKSAQTLSALGELAADMRPLANLDQFMTSMKATVEGLTTVSTLKGASRSQAFEDARKHTDRWMFKGGTGTYTRAVTLPECVRSARQERRNLLVRLEVIDPTDESLCEKYSSYRTSLSSEPDGTGAIWTTGRARKESFATLLAARWYQQRFQLLDIAIGLSSSMSTFRFDLSSSCIIITQDDPEFPAVRIARESPLYDGFTTELSTSLSQARQVPISQSAARFSELPTPVEARQFFTEIGILLPRSYDDQDLEQIIDKAIHAKNPYG